MRYKVIISCSVNVSHSVEMLSFTLVQDRR